MESLYKRIIRSRKPKQPEVVLRVCLMCETQFKAKGRLIRLCKECRKSEIFKYY